jgi:uncharacterized membrane protein YhaH (DUF805 family)
MNVRNLFLSVNRRIGRGQFWLGVVAIWVVSWVLEWVFGVPITDDPATSRLRVIAFLISLVTIYPTAAIAAKRLHDRDKPAAYVWVLVAAFIVIQVGDLARYFDIAAPMTWPKLIVMIVLAAIVLSFLIELGFRRGTPGANRYGPDPVGERS